MTPPVTYLRRRWFWIADAETWAAENPVLPAGNLGFETDTMKSKWGDGVTLWNLLAYVGAGNVGGTRIPSQPPPGHYKVLNLYVNAETGKLEVEYEIPGG